MTTINEIFRSFGPEYLERFSQGMPHAHRKVIDAIIACRTEACGAALSFDEHIQGFGVTLRIPRGRARALR